MVLDQSFDLKITEGSLVTALRDDSDHSWIACARRVRFYGFYAAYFIADGDYFIIRIVRIILSEFQESLIDAGFCESYSNAFVFSVESIKSREKS